jgi:hypothetical protein
VHNKERDVVEARDLSNLRAGRQVITGYLGIAVAGAAGERYEANAFCVKVLNGVRRAFDEINEELPRHTPSMVIRVSTAESALTWRSALNPAKYPNIRHIGRCRRQSHALSAAFSWLNQVSGQIT